MAAFQWINAKGWTLALGALPAFTTSAACAQHDALLITIVVAGVGLATCAAWALLGTATRGELKSERRHRIFNRSMALLLLASIVPMAIGLRV